MQEVKHLAKVESAGLNITDRGILMVNLTVHYEEGLHQNILNLVLDDYDEEQKALVGSDYGCEIIRQLLLFFNVDDFNDMAGQVVYVIGKQPSGFLSFKPESIEHLNILKGSRPARFDWKQVAKDFIEEKV